MDRKRIDILHNRKQPTNITQVRSLLGIFGYYEVYIKDFIKLMKPIYKLLENTINRRQIKAITWFPKHEAVTETVVSKLTDSILKILLEKNVFVVETDASFDVIAGVLSIIRNNEKFLVEFYGRTLNKTEQK